MKNDKKLIAAISMRGIRLQKDLENLKANDTDRESSNPQRLWRDLKGFIQVITKAMMKQSFLKTNSRIKAIEKDRNETKQHPDFGSSPPLQRHEAFLASELDYLEQKQGKHKKDALQAKLASHGEKLEGIWTAMSKDKKPKDLIQRLKVPNSFPPKFEQDSKRMANLARNYHNDLQKQDQNKEDPEETKMRNQDHPRRNPDRPEAKRPEHNNLEPIHNRIPSMKSPTLSKNRLSHQPRWMPIQTMEKAKHEPRCRLLRQQRKL